MTGKSWAWSFDIVVVTVGQDPVLVIWRMYMYEGGSESSVIGVITLLIYMIGCCIIP